MPESLSGHVQSGSGAKTQSETPCLCFCPPHLWYPQGLYLLGSWFTGTWVRFRVMGGDSGQVPCPGTEP